MASRIDLDLLLARSADQETQLPTPPSSGPSAPAMEGQTGTTAPGSNGGDQEAAPPGGLGSMLLPFAILLLFMWFFVMRPERKRQKERSNLLAAIKKGDQVVTIGGLHGQVVRLDEQTVTIKVADDHRLKFDRSAISRIASAKSDGQASGPAATQPAELAAAAR